MNDSPSIEELKKGILQQDITALSKAISLVESSKAEHKAKAQKLIEELMPYTGKARRIGISGTPGAGKSTCIESLGLQFIENGDKVAVLAVDPSSIRTRGSILGDKTRMEQLSKNPNAFIRPSPSKGYYGGIALNTYEAMLLCEAFSFNVILIETVGVGQSEIMVADIVDMFLLVAVSGGGDELQGIKRGIMEITNLVLINKVDEEPNPQDMYFYTDLQRALKLFPSPVSHWKTPVIMGSALYSKNLTKVMTAIDDFFTLIKENGYLETHRKHQNSHRFEVVLQQSILDTYLSVIQENPEYERLKSQVVNGEIFTLEAVTQLLQNMG